MVKPAAAFILMMIMMSGFAHPSAAQGRPLMIGPMEDVFSQPNPCTGELVIGTARSFVIIYSRLDSSGGSHLTMRSSTKLLAQIPLTGVKYVSNNEDVLEFNAPSSGSVEFTSAQNHVVVRQAEDDAAVLPTAHDDDFLVKGTAHTTVNSNGLITVTFERSREAACLSGRGN
jgi:hypothetical protein